jgi:hypothetical protein
VTTPGIGIGDLNAGVFFYLLIFGCQCAILSGVLWTLMWLFNTLAGKPKGSRTIVRHSMTKTYLSWSFTASSAALLAFAYFAFPQCLPEDCIYEHRHFLGNLMLPGNYTAVAGLLLGLRGVGKLRFISIALSLIFGSFWFSLMVGYGI